LLCCTQGRFSFSIDPFASCSVLCLYPPWQSQRFQGCRTVWKAHFYLLLSLGLLFAKWKNLCFSRVVSRPQDFQPVKDPKAKNRHQIFCLHFTIVRCGLRRVRLPIATAVQGTTLHLRWDGSKSQTLQSQNRLSIPFRFRFINN
jgi:hypothetical protein